MTRARALAGLRVGELARRLEQWVSADPRKSKGVAGQLAERALGATAGSLDEPDFLELGIELKTLPVAESGAPKESTYVCTLPLQTLHDVDFEDSAVFRKLRRVLWLPIEAASERPLVERHYGSAFLWSPSPDELEVLRADYEAVAEKVISGRVEEVRGDLGVALQVRPKAANGRQRTLAPDGDEGFVWTGPRGFYLRPSFTGALLARAFG
ncbi:MAG: hypothetical protein H6724_04525 [Sandaracinus sp.]|nr:hypothetical protein [Sandaracinus sp.]